MARSWIPRGDGRRAHNPTRGTRAATGIARDTASERSTSGDEPVAFPGANQPAGRRARPPGAPCDPDGVPDSADAVVAGPEPCPHGGRGRLGCGARPGGVTPRPRPRPQIAATAVRPTLTDAVSGTHSPRDRTSDRRAINAGSSASAAATAVSMAVRHRIPSAVAAGISAASRTAPDCGVGVLPPAAPHPTR